MSDYRSLTWIVFALSGGRERLSASYGTSGTRVRGGQGCHGPDHHLCTKASTLVLIQGCDRRRQTTTPYRQPSFVHLLLRNLRLPPLCYRPTLVSATCPRSLPSPPRRFPPRICSIHSWHHRSGPLSPVCYNRLQRAPPLQLSKAPRSRWR